MQCIVDFSQQFDPSEILIEIANNPVQRKFIQDAPDLVSLDFILNVLWPQLDLLPLDPENPGIALIAEFMLNELLLKNSDSLQLLNLRQLKTLYGKEPEAVGSTADQDDDGDGEEAYSTDMDEVVTTEVDAFTAVAQQADDDGDDHTKTLRRIRTQDSDPIDPSKPKVQKTTITEKSQEKEQDVSSYSEM